MGFLDQLKKDLGQGMNAATQIGTFGMLGYNPDNDSYGAGEVGKKWRTINPVLNAGYSAAGDDPSKKNVVNFDTSEAGQRRSAAYDYGRALGQKEFYDDPDMIKMRQTREDLAKGYDGAELGALRGEAKANVQGQRSTYMDQLKGNLAKSGVGGARGAAVQNAANQKFAAQGAENERKVLLDSGKMKREGVNDLQDYLMRQKLGALGLAYGQQSLSSADFAAEKGVQAAQSGGKK